MTTSADELVKTLRNLLPGGHGQYYCVQAADLIEAQAREIAKLEEDRDRLLRDFERFELIEQRAEKAERGMAQLNADNQRLRERLAEIREVWAGSEFGQVAHDPLVLYWRHIGRQMYDLAVEALK